MSTTGDERTNVPINSFSSASPIGHQLPQRRPSHTAAPRNSVALSPFLVTETQLHTERPRLQTRGYQRVKSLCPCGAVIVENVVCKKCQRPAAGLYTDTRSEKMDWIAR